MGDYQATVLVVDDDTAVTKVLKAILVQAGMKVRDVEAAEQALEVVRDQGVDVVISDVQMPGMDGMELLSELRRREPSLPVIMLTAHGSVPLAVAAMKSGAADFLLKPFDRDELLYVVRKALKTSEHAEDKAAIGVPGAFVGSAPAMTECFSLIDKVAPGTATVLVRGESGTGKELVAQAIHDKSGRSGALIKLHCGALPDNLLESELFGYEKGAFTGAASRKPGRVELAEGGTLFLDEIGDVTPALQVKLLRLLQEREFERLGGTKTHRADVRFVAATHRDLETMVEAGEFREDLFYRLNVVPIWTPPLRERQGDIVALSRHFCALFASLAGDDRTLDDDALDRLEAEPWPGNVRQLQNFIERLLLLSDGPTVGAADVDRELARQRGLRRPQREADEPPKGGDTLDEQMRLTELEALETALARANNNRTVAARILGISRRTLYNKIADHHLD